MGKPDAPTPPNPLTTAAAQTSTNVQSAVANAYLNNMNQITPQGNLTFNATGSYGWTDPTTGQTYQIPTFTSTQTQSPEEQAIFSQNQAARYNLAGMANAQSNRVSGLLSTPFSPTDYAPAGGNASGIQAIPSALTSYAGGGPIQTGLGNYGQQATTFDNTGLANASNIQGTYGPADNYSADRQRVEDALMARMNPQLQIQQDQLRQQLADQGIRYGSDAYNNAFQTYNQQANDARWGAISQAGQEQARMQQQAGALAAFQNQAQQQAYQEALGRGQFGNEAQTQAYQQALGAGTFANAAQAQQYGQNASAATFANAGLAQQQAQQQAAFNAQQAARNQWMQEQYAQRNQPLNEISALMSGGQVSSPNWLNAPQSQIPTTDVAGLINNQFNQQNSIYGQQNANYQSLMGGLLGLGAGALKLSDEREKENIKPLGTVLSAKGDDDPKMASVFGADSDAARLPIYAYSYKDDPASTRHIGPMAQDVEDIDDKAVINKGGRKYIDTGRVMGNILRAS